MLVTLDAVVQVQTAQLMIQIPATVPGKAADPASYMENTDEVQGSPPQSAPVRAMQPFGNEPRDVCPHSFLPSFILSLTCSL